MKAQKKSTPSAEADRASITKMAHALRDHVDGELALNDCTQDDINHVLLQLLKQLPPGLNHPNTATRQIAADVLHHCRLLHLLMKMGNTHGAIFRAYELGRLVERLPDPIINDAIARVQDGKCQLHLLGHTWIEVTPIEKRILDHVGDADRVDLHELVKTAWGQRYHRDNRHRYDKALSHLNAKAAAAGVCFHIDGENLYVERFGA